MDGAQWLETILRKCAEHAASDLVFEPDRNGGLRAVMRLDGVRRSIAEAPAGEAKVVIGRLKALASLPAYITDEAQDGRIDGRSFGIAGDIRLATIPTVLGERVALRLPALGPLPEPAALGLSAALVADLKRLLRQPDGLVLLAGPTGSGKTTTIHSFMADLAAERADRQIMSLEDPVERHVDGIAQVEIDAHHKFDFPDALRAALRQDVDIIVVGEIRDVVTARTCVQAALSGHLVVATVHAGRAQEVVPRLVDMGVDKQLLLSALQAVLAQRLLRLRDTEAGDGYRHRKVISDWLIVDASSRESWLHGEAPDLHIDMDQQALALVEARLTDRQEVDRVLG